MGNFSVEHPVSFHSILWTFNNNVFDSKSGVLPTVLTEGRSCIGEDESMGQSAVPKPQPSESSLPATVGTRGIRERG